VRGVGLLHQDREIHSCRPAADDVDSHLSELPRSSSLAGLVIADPPLLQHIRDEG
jgi:hypothetical protein